MRPAPAPAPDPGNGPAPAYGRRFILQTAAHRAVWAFIHGRLTLEDVQSARDEHEALRALAAEALAVLDPGDLADALWAAIYELDAPAKGAP